MAFTLTDSLSFTGTGTVSSVHLNTVTNYSASIVAIASNGAITSVTDSKGNVYTSTVNTSNAGLFTYEFHSFYAVLDTTTTITVTPTVGTTVWSATWQLVSGGLNTLDKSSTSFGTGTAITSGATATTTTATEFVFGFGAQANNRPWTVGSGYTSIQQAANGTTASVFSEYQNVSSTGAQTATASIDLSNAWVFGVATFSSVTLTQPTVVQLAAYAGTAATTTMVFTLPSTPIIGNLLVFIANWAPADAPRVTPTGWTLYNDYEPTGIATSVYWRTVQSGDTTSWTLTYDTTADQNSGFMLEIAGANTGASAFNGLNHSYLTTTPTTITTGTQTPTVLNCLAIANFVNNGSGGTDSSTITSGWKKHSYAAASFQPSWIFTKTALTSDTTTGITATISSMTGGGVDAIGSVILIDPFVAGGTTSPHNLFLMGIGS